MVRTWIWIVAFVCLIGSWLIALGTPATNEDLFLAFCSGRETLAQGPAWLDTWSFTIPGKLWVDQAWLSHLIYYLSYLGIKEAGPVMLKGVLLAACLMILYFHCRNLAVGPAISLIATSLGTLAVAPFLGIRAQNFGMLYFICFATLLTAPASWGRWRQIGALLVLAVWSNSHGSFMLGFFLLAARVLVDVLDILNPAGLFRQEPVIAQSAKGKIRTDRVDLWGWLIVTVLAIGVMAWANPYGWENLRVPFRQLFATSITPQWVDWLPLIHGQTLFDHGFLGPASVLPFLALAALMGLLLLAMPIAWGSEASVFALVRGLARADALMGVAILVVLTPLVYKFQRIIIFAAPAMIPILGLLIQGNVQLAVKHFPKLKDWANGRMSLACYAAAFAVLIAAGMLVHRAAIVPHLPGNPLYPPMHGRPLAAQLMSFRLDCMDAVEFMKRNDIKGKMFSDEHLSDYLLFNVPRIKVFFDLRAQSLYPDEIIGAYLSVLGTVPERMDQTIDILDRYGVSLIVLNARRDRSFSVATLLMQTKKWVCIFYDGNVVILVRADSERFGPIAISGTLDELWYPKSETKIVTRAALSRFMTGTINSELLRSIIRSLHDHPDPNVYSLVLSVMKGPSECLDTETKHWLESEAQRLAALNYMVPDGFTSILRSLLNVLQVLEDDQAACGSRTTAPNKYGTMRRKVASIADELLRQYR